MEINGYFRESLDLKVCDITKKFPNTETFREVIQRVEKKYRFEPKDLENITEEELEDYIEILAEYIF